MLSHMGDLPSVPEGTAATTWGLSSLSRIISTATSSGLTNFVVAIAKLLGGCQLRLLGFNGSIIGRCCRSGTHGPSRLAAPNESDALAKSCYR